MMRLEKWVFDIVISDVMAFLTEFYTTSRVCTRAYEINYKRNDLLQSLGNFSFIFSRGLKIYKFCF